MNDALNKRLLMLFLRWMQLHQYYTRLVNRLNQAAAYEEENGKWACDPDRIIERVWETEGEVGHAEWLFVSTLLCHAKEGCVNLVSTRVSEDGVKHYVVRLHSKFHTYKIIVGLAASNELRWIESFSRE